MMRTLNVLPLDYSLCTGTVTVYHREGLTRQVLEGVHLECTRERSVNGGVESLGGTFLLIVPYPCGIVGGDRIEGEGGSFVVSQVRTCRLGDRFCHMEVR